MISSGCKHVDKICVEEDKYICIDHFFMIVILKKDNEIKQDIIREIKVLQVAPKCENLMGYFAHTITDKTALILLELCEGGTLAGLMEKYLKIRFSESQIVQIIKDLVKGVRALHKIGLAHRDLKLENILLHLKKFKICDFGACSKLRIKPDLHHKEKQKIIEGVFQRQSTQMYRPPEMMSPYLKFPVGLKTDIWQIGCILYTVAFFKHPFQEASTLTITQAKYSYPAKHPYTTKLLHLISILLERDPSDRPDINQLFHLLDNYDEIKDMDIELEHLSEKVKPNVWKLPEMKKTASQIQEKEENDSDSSDIFG